MAENWLEHEKHTSTAAPSSGLVSRRQIPSPRRSRQRNIFHLLTQREVSPRTKHQARRIWNNSPICDPDLIELRFADADAKHGIFSWAESQSLHRWSAKYCPLLPPPRSTIAAAFSPDGKTLVSTHGDHTVKIIDCHTGKCLKVLSGHRRTPWVVRYHPLYSDILASGSLDHEVRLWDANTSDCIGSQDFHRPIASIAFHARGEILAVASGHKLYIWNYNKRDESSVPAIILKTRRSLRAVHFHPHGAPYLLTAEVNNIESADSPLTLSTSSGYSNYPSALFVTNTNSRFCPHLESNVPSPCLLLPAYLRDDGILHVLGNDSSSTSAQQRSSLVQVATLDTENQQPDQFATLMDVCPGEPTASNDMVDVVPVPASNGIEMHGADGQSNSRLQGSSSISNFERFGARDDLHVSSPSNTEPIPSTAGLSGSDARRAMPLNMLITGGLDVQMLLRNVESGQPNLFGNSRNWELPFLQGFLMAQNHTGLHPALVNNNVLEDLSIDGTAGTNNLTRESPHMHNFGRPGASSSIPITAGSSRGSNRRYASRSVPGVGSSLLGPQIDEAEVHAASLGVGSEITAPMFTPGTELPCTVKLRIWRHNIKEPCRSLEPEACRLTISHAVLCSEMGAHFSPCGRFLVACVACLLPQTEGDRGSQLPVPYDSAGAGSSPTRHPLPSHRVIYELRVYSLEEATFGDILASRAIRAAHCLTSIQFSPTSEHILLAYGRRHGSLLRSIVMEGDNGIPVYTILEVYRVSDMELVRVLPSAEDEVNVACFHPSPGGGLVYGTKEGKLRILQHNGADTTTMGMGCFVEENMLEAIQRYALEG
ncbi:hypothetical protein SEVIR_5G278100v4 [Setaria viridis]|uniref:Uncharacterized protein n=2 Tax=Setaria TaxID=4554 RepID=K3XEK6_SETIT|nr:uncharacterized protein LOC101760572 isoform X2 [Setaria italica]XP_034595427.1 uncharacterized protein LOC117857059 isoform X2 [Setaria viridis]TKW16114.1 hypothetical protein SEVIR_5G278100v2 [Setaria viridis]